MKQHHAIQRIVIPLLLAAAACIPASTAMAGKDDHVEARQLLHRGDILPLTAIMDAASRRVPGDIIEIELEHEDDAWEYKVKVLTPTGRVKKLEIDARNGAVLKIKDD